MTQEQEFWLVWNPDRSMPRVRHESRDRAESEANRLARQHVGESFVVLRSTSRHVVEPPPVAIYELTDTRPF